MVKKASKLIKEVFKDFNIIDLDTKNEINSIGNYMIFDSLIRASALKLDISFSIYMAVKILKDNDSIYSLMDNIYTKCTNAYAKGEKIECKKIHLFSFENNLFIYKVDINIQGEIK